MEGALAVAVWESDLPGASWPGPEEIATRQFGIVLKGYRPDEVHDFLRAVAERVAQLALTVERERARNQDLERRTLPTQDDSYTRLARDLSAMVRAADETSRRIVAAATREARVIEASGRDRAVEWMATAREEAEEVLAGAIEETQRVLDRAREEADRLLSGAREEAERVVSVAREEAAWIRSAPPEGHMALAERDPWAGSGGATMPPLPFDVTVFQRFPRSFEGVPSAPGAVPDPGPGMPDVEEFDLALDPSLIEFFDGPDPDR